ncbi:ligand-binding sensor domain-containing protein [Haliscomenobacter hydrossis]|uniref:Two component regulator propeller domain protein n=1 Tax=Haliscomenobacter hydrossis (strain ATCC 27775 / DSM 1100 / LMG 10767 / O) TaxID=760192 RepID=F4KS53_HALH1|nr:two-component regulator propeller domain-containing protein [Haliscomenobacter hydrossis]AEE52298.1 two component regulator propeller domain protein [Haliscomenobacter hydrossis DSM 1100]
MALNRILLFSFLTIFTACNGQEKTYTLKDLNTSQPGLKVIRNFKAAALAPDFDTTLVSQYIRSIFQDSKGNLWFGTLGEGVVRYDVKTLTYFSHPDGFINNTVYAINEDKNGNMWFGTDQGVYKYDPSATLRAGGKTFKNYNQKDGLSHIDITRKGILVDKSGTIWVGTHGGVFRYDPSADSKGAQSFSLFQELPPINVAGIMEDKSGNIWFASSNKGVFRYDPSAYFDSAQHKSLTAGGKTITNIAEKEGLGDNYAGGIAEDQAGNIWFTMKNGICKYDGRILTGYTPKDGLGGTEFWGIYIEQSGIIWVTARGSTTRFDPSVPLPNPQAFTVFTPANGLNCCVQSMYQDRSGNMWWGAGQGLYRFDGQRFYQVKQNGPW